MTDKPKAYIETTIVSYLAARPSRDLVVAAHQRVTRDWWDSNSDFDLFVSQFVLDEAASGDVDAATRRLAIIEDANQLEITLDAIELADELLLRSGLPAKARLDALHIAVAAVHGMDYLLTWNCRHIANATLRGSIEETCRAAGFEPPAICTPLELPKER